MARPPDFRLKHVAVPATRFAETEAFYALLGGRRGFARNDDTGAPQLVQMNFGDRFVELIAAGGDTTEPTGHLAFTTPDIAAAWQLFADNGVTPLDQPRAGASGVMWFFVTDPSGNRVEITAPIASPQGVA